MSTRRVTLDAIGTVNWSGSFATLSTIRTAIVNSLHAQGYGNGALELSSVGVGQVLLVLTFEEVDCTYDLNLLKQQMRQIVLGSGYFESVGTFTVRQDAGCNASGGGNIGGVVGIGQVFQNLFGGGGSGNTYTVVRGDTFNGIAARFNLTPQQLHALNPQITNINLIHVGQILTIRGVAGGGSIQNPPFQVVTAVNTNTGTVQTQPASVPGRSSNPAPPDNRNWFDKTFFDGAGALTGTAVGVLIVLGAVVVVKTTRG